MRPTTPGVPLFIVRDEKTKGRTLRWRRRGALLWKAAKIGGMFAGWVALYLEVVR